MEQLFGSDSFGDETNIQDFLISDLNSDYLINSEPSSFPSYDQSLNFYFGSQADTENSEHSPRTVTKKIQKMPIDRKRYHNITNEQRTELIDAVKNKKEKIKHAAKRLGINYSSAKYIYQIYMREGRKDKIIFKRKSVKEQIPDQAQNGTVYTSPVSSVFSTQIYNIPNQRGDQSMLYHTNCMVPNHFLTAPAQEENREIFKGNTGIITEKENLIDRDTPKENFPSADSATFPLSLSDTTRITPPNCLDPHNQVQSNPNMPACANIMQLNLQPIPISSQNFLPGQNQVANYSIYAPDQAHAAQFIHPPAYMPLNNPISLPAHTQAPSLQCQIYAPNFKTPFPNLNGYNHMTMPVMMYFIGNPQSLTIDNAHIQTANQ